MLWGLIPFLAVVSFLPGYALARRWGLSTSERLVIAPAVSWGLIFLGGFAVYIIPLPRWGYLLVTALIVVPALRAAPELGRTLRERDVRPMMLVLGVMALWLLGWQLLPRGYSGGALFYDWIEHYFRSRLFADHWDRNSMWGPYKLPARPPLVNVVCGYVMAHFGSGMPVYQAAYALLSACTVLPAAMLARQWGGGSKAVWVAGCFLALNAMFVENATYSWTRGPTSYLILTTIWLYVRAAEGVPRFGPTAMAFGVGALAILAHYSAGPYVVVLAVHLGWRLVVHRGRGWRAVMAAAATSVALLLPWFAWSFAVFGEDTTVGNNSSVATIGPLSAKEFAQVFWVNLRDSLVAPMTDAYRIGMFVQDNPWGALRDRLFIVYQTNLWFGLGVANLLALIGVIIWRPWRGREGVSPGGRFWIGFGLAVAVLGIVVHGPKDHPLGLAHICLQPLIFMGVVWGATWLGRVGRGLRVCWLGLMTVEALGTIALHFYIQSIAVVEVGRPIAGRVEFDQSAGLSHHTYANFEQKALHHLAFLGDAAAPYQAWIWGGLAGLTGLWLWAAWREARVAPENKHATAAGADG